MNTEKITPNQVTLFSNGIGHFRRTYNINANKPEKISIPFKRDHVGDVLASLSIFGHVKYDSPPSFTPVNSNATSLTIRSDNALRSLLTSLVGAEVSLEVYGATKKGTLLGIESNDSQFENTVIKNDYVIITNCRGICKYHLPTVTSVHFEEESVRSEIDKALKNSFQKIKPDSTFLDLSLSVLDLNEEKTDETAIVQYTVPVAAWKMRYNVRLEKGNAYLEGTAIIDNNTDEDWDNFIVSVVTGNPISFSTDLAQVKVPNRSHVNLIDTKVQGNINVEDGAGFECMLGAVAAPTNILRSAKSVTRGMATAASYQNSAYSTFGAAPVMDDVAALAISSGVDAKDVGDFCIFTSKESITIQSKRSAVVPMFQVPLTKSAAVLLYKEVDHATRPWRAVKFKNETTYSLGRGKVVVYQDGVFSGESILEAAKPGDNRMLPHCLENSVKINKKPKPTESKITSVSLADGFVYTETVCNAHTVYEITNKTENEFKFILEHTANWKDGVFSSEGADVHESEKISDGVRLYLTLPANGKITLLVKEEFVQNSSFGLNYHTLNSNFISIKHPISSKEELLPIIKQQEELDKIILEINDLQTRIEDLNEQAERCRKNLQATKNETGSSIRDSWVLDLDTTEKEIRNIEKVLLPEKVNLKNKKTAEINDLIKKTTVAWKV